MTISICMACNEETTNLLESEGGKERETYIRWEGYVNKEGKWHGQEHNRAVGVGQCKIGDG